MCLRFVRQRGHAMSSSTFLRWLANAVLIVHIGFILFVVVGLLLVVVGGIRKWQWVRNLWFRLLHVSAIGVVAVESWLGITCPLTKLENQLRQSAGQIVSSDDFIAFWVRRLFFFQVPPWAFTICYSCFLGLVVGSWLLVSPRSRSTERST